MRDPRRLYTFYSEFARIHAERFPDWREGQLWSNFMSWLHTYKKVDPFYPETNEMLDFFKEFAGIKEENKK